MLVATPEFMASAATDLATIGSDLSAAHVAAAAPTVSLLPAAADEVSAAVTHLFSQHAAGYQALAGQAAAFQEQFVQHLHAAAFSYADAEAALASWLQNLNPRLDAVVNTLVWFVSSNAALFTEYPPRQALGILESDVLFSPLTLWLHYVFFRTGQFPQYWPWDMWHLTP
jgi:hypothetical protein